MSLVNGSADSMLGGVSQRPVFERDPSEAVEQVNGWSSPAFGLLKRPPTKHVAQLDASNTGFGDAFDYTIRRDALTRDRVVVKNGQVRVFDHFTGAERTVTGGTSSYLATTKPNKNIRAVTVGDSTFIVNREKTVGRLTTKSDAPTNGSLISVRQVDFTTVYRIKLALTVGDAFPPGPGFGGIDINSILNQPVTTEYITPAGDTPAQRALITTDSIAKNLVKLLAANATLAAIYNFSQFGSVVYIERKDGAVFALAVEDGLSGQGLIAIRNQITNFADLPPVAPQGYKVLVSGNPDSEFDDYWVTYDGVHTVAGQGVWRETMAPDLFLDLDPATMPHQLIRHTPKPIRMTQTASPDAHAHAEPFYDTVPFTDSVWTLNGSAVAVTSRPILSAAADVMYCYLPNSTNKDNRVIIRYVMDTRKLEAGNSVIVFLDQETGVGTGVYSNITSVGFSPALNMMSQFSQELTNCVSGTNQKLRLRITYATAPSSSSKQAIFTVFAQNDGQTGITGIEYSRHRGTKVSMDPSLKFPLVSATAVTVTGYNFATAADPTPAGRIANLLQGLAGTSGLNCYTTGKYSFVVEFTSLSTSGIPPVVVTSGLAFSLFGAMVVYDPTTTDLALPQTGALVTGLDASGTPTGFTGIVASQNDYSMMITWNVGVDPDPTNTEVTFTSPGVESFEFTSAEWRGRECGDDTTNPFPSIYNRNLTDVFFHRGRLGFLADDRIVMSSTADLFNFWRQTALQVLDDDLIDVQNASQHAAFFHSAVEWDSQLLILSDLSVFEVTGEPILSPRTIKVTSLMNVASSRNVRPLAVGRRVFIPRTRATDSSITEVVELSRDPVADGSGLVNTTGNLPSYMVGAPVVCAGDDGAGLFFVLTDQGNLYVHSYRYVGGTKTVHSWSKWTLSGTVLGMDMSDGVLTLTMSHGDGIFLETIDLTKAPTAAVSHEDRQGWTTTVPYTFSYAFSTIYPTRILRNFELKKDTLGKLQMRFLELNYVGSRSFSVTVSQPKRADRTSTFSSAAEADGSLKVALMGKSTDLTIVLSDASVYPCGFAGYAWEATYHTRSQRLS